MVAIRWSTPFKITTSRVSFLPKCQQKTLKYLLKKKTVPVKFEWRSEGSTVVRAPDPGVDAMCGLSLFLVLSFAAPITFSQGTPVSPLLKNQPTNYQIPIRPGTHGHI